MKGIIISSNMSGGGKTTVTLALMNLLKKKGFKIQPYKVGPDYIDTAFHSEIVGIKSRNLDLHLMGEEGVKASISRGNGDLAVIEGVMGLYDGKDITPEYSTAHLAKILDLPVVLVLSPKAQVATICAEILGLINFMNINIAGIILNNINESYFKLLKLAIETRCNVKVFGYLPKDDDIVLNSRHLGLIQSSEVLDLTEKIDKCSSLLEKNINLNELLSHFKSILSYEDPYHIKSKDLKIGVAFDRAFSFYYKENLELLEEAGEVIYFSPMKDKKIIDGLDFIYLGGGYPEAFLNDLSSNVTMLESIKSALENGIRCYAECGGFMYLTESIQGQKTVGFLQGHSFMTNSLQRFGYAELEVIKENRLLPKGMKINCHEFHTSYIESNENKIYEVRKTLFDSSVKEWQCGCVKNNTLATYAHVHFFGNMKMFESLLEMFVTK